MRCASLAAQSGTSNVDAVNRLAQAIYSFAIAGLGEGGEKKLDEPQDSITFHELADPARVQARNAVINSPVIVLRALRERHVEAFEAIGLEKIGQLVMHDWTAAEGVPSNALSAAIETAVSPLRAMGLTYGMTSDQVRGWILGESDGETAR